MSGSNGADEAPNQTATASSESWMPEVEEIERQRARALEMGGEERVARQHDRGKLTARERIELLFDPGSFEEIGMLADHSSVRDNLPGLLRGS